MSTIELLKCTRTIMREILIMIKETKRKETKHKYIHQ